MIIASGMDIGTNSFRLLVAHVAEGRLRPLAHDLVTVRLGEGLGSTGCLSKAAMLRGEAALARFVAIMAPYPGHHVRACATHALRAAANSQEFLQRVQSLFGFSLEVLSGAEEGRLALLGALSALPEEQRCYPLVLVDVGGGSTEVILQTTAESEPRLISLSLGAVGLSEEFGADLSGMRKKIGTILAPVHDSIAKGAGGGEKFLLMASGGTATSLAAFALGLDRYEPQRVQNYTMSQAALARLVARLAAYSPGERNTLPGLAEGRGEIIVAGSLILQEVQQALASPVLVSDAGLLEGVVLSGASAG
jgi:exopolyphosphatase/guanosine-5'-triphosphate,3'-diphosphate pyrophosphatase